MKKFSEISKSLRVTSRLKESESYTKYDRESFITGSLIKIGDIVEHNGLRAEVIDVGSNYATLIRNGKSFKSWITEITVIDSNIKNNSPIMIDENNISFKGYKTKQFTSDISSKFIEAFTEKVDPFAFYNCIVACDSLLAASPKSLIEKFYKYNNDFERVSRYFDKFGIEISRIKNIGEAINLIKENVNEFQ